MNKVFQNSVALFLVIAFSLKAGFFPVSTGEAIFPFTCQNTISPLYPPLGNIAPSSPDLGVRLANFLNENLKYNANHPEPFHGFSAVMPNAIGLVPASLNHVLDATRFLIISLQTFRIIFPFHAFW